MQKGVPQKQLAMEVGLKQPYLCKAENNNGSLLFEEVESIAAVLDRPISDFATRYSEELPMVPLRPK